MFLAIAMMTNPLHTFGQTCTNTRTMTIIDSVNACYTPTCTSGLFHPLGTIPANNMFVCKNAMGDGMRIHAYSPFEPMPTIRFSYHSDGVLDCSKERAGRIGIMPPMGEMPPTVLYPVSKTGWTWDGAPDNLQESDVFLVATCQAKDLLLSTNNSTARIKLFTTATEGTQLERMTILSNGNVGINTHAPGYNLQVVNHIAVGAGTGSSTYDPTLAGKMTLFPGNSGWWYHIDNRAENGLTFSGGPTLGDYDIMSMYGNGAQVFIGAQYGSTTAFNPAVAGKLTVSEDATTTGTGYHAYASDILFRVERRNQSASTTVKLISAGINTAESFIVKSDGTIQTSTLAGTGNRPVYANASGELIDAGSVGSSGSWTLGGNTISTNSYFLGTKDNYSLVFKTNDTKKMEIFPDGKVNIGTAFNNTSHNTNYLLSVSGKIACDEVIVLPGTDWSDFVFDDDYALPSLIEVESYIKENKHLPDIPSAQDVKENGISVGDMQAKLLQKIEELTLHVIRIEKELQQTKTQVRQQSKGELK